MTDKEKIRAEIKRRLKALKDCHADRIAGYAGEISGLERLLSFLNTLEVKEVDLEEADVFPELKESEDERIRKEIIAVFKGQIAFTSEETGKKYIAWLEKQGEQKPTWSEEDEEMLAEIICDIEGLKEATEYPVNKEVYDDEINWLKSLKEKMKGE